MPYFRGDCFPLLAFTGKCQHMTFCYIRRFWLLSFVKFVLLTFLCENGALLSLLVPTLRHDNYISANVFCTCKFDYQSTCKQFLFIVCMYTAVDRQYSPKKLRTSDKEAKNVDRLFSILWGRSAECAVLFGWESLLTSLENPW